MALRNKLYYPQSHIITNLYTTGKEWMLEDGTEYIGFYHRYIDNTVLTEAVYNETVSKKLIPYISKIEQPTTFLYDSLKPRSRFKSPISIAPVPTLDDYKSGKFTRYFLRRRNFTSYQDIIEINKLQYDSWKISVGGIDSTIYNAIFIDWKLTGPLNDYKSDTGLPIYGVFDTNKRIVELKDVTFPGLKSFLTDYIEYSIHSKAVNDDIKKLFGSNR